MKKGKKQPDTSLRDTENVPLKEDIKEYFEREVLPFAPDAWVDEKKSKVDMRFRLRDISISMKLQDHQQKLWQRLWI